MCFPGSCWNCGIGTEAACLCGDIKSTGPMTSCVGSPFPPADELCELKEENPALTAKEKESVEEKEETHRGGGEKGQQEVEKEVTEEKESAGGGVKDAGDDEEMEELRAQVFSLLLELDQTREDSQCHEESALELQGGHCTTATQTRAHNLQQRRTRKLNTHLCLSDCCQVCSRRSAWPVHTRPRALVDTSRSCKVGTT